MTSAKGSISSLINRREFLVQTSTLTAASFVSSNLFSFSPALSAEPQIPNRDTTLKFNPDGTRRPFAGNTVICHLPVQCSMRDAMLELHHALEHAPFRHKLGLTSTDSYHMTIFPGANDQDRMVSGWPAYVPADAPIDACSRMVGEKMEKVRLKCELPLRVRIDQVATTGFHTACSLRMDPADPDENAKLRSIRDQLADVYGFRLNNHATYQFHITMSYQMSPFTFEEQSDYRELLAKHIRQIIDAQPVLELGNPEYCTFPDMFRFIPRKLLSCS
jgi:hypothetical protein